MSIPRTVNAQPAAAVSVSSAQMLNLPWLLLVHVIALALVMTLASATFADTNEQAIKTLESKGLDEIANTWILEADKSLRKDMAELRRAKAQFDRVTREQKSFERQIRKFKGYIASLQHQIDKAKEAERKADDRREWNRAVDLKEELIDKVEAITKEKAEREHEMEMKIDQAQGDYVTLLMEIVEKVEATRAKYEALSNDQEVTDALATLSKDSTRPHELGPSRLFNNNARLIDRWGESIQAGEIELRKEGNTLWIDVVINNQARRGMVLDTGADRISVPYDLAVELGIEPTEEDELARLQMADGSIVEARAKMLDSVQVGKFIVRNVDCFVLPRDLIAAEPLLGGSFLKHFTYHIDPERGKLRMSRTEGPVAETAVDQMPEPEEADADAPGSNQPATDQPAIAPAG